MGATTRLLLCICVRRTRVQSQGRPTGVSTRWPYFLLLARDLLFKVAKHTGAQRARPTSRVVDPPATPQVRRRTPNRRPTRAWTRAVAKQPHRIPRTWRNSPKVLGQGACTRREPHQG